MQVTPKGIAVVAAIESGLLCEVEGGWDDTVFKSFWEKFEKLLTENNLLIVKMLPDRKCKS